MSGDGSDAAVSGKKHKAHIEVIFFFFLVAYIFGRDEVSSRGGRRATKGSVKVFFLFRL